jgi:hypothetical protein
MQSKLLLLMVALAGQGDSQVASPGLDMVFAAVGVAIALLGLAMVTDYRHVGSRMVDWIPLWAQVGRNANFHRKFLGFGYIGFGVLVAVVTTLAAVSHHP